MRDECQTVESNMAMDSLVDRSQCAERFMPPNTNGSNGLDIFFLIMRTFVWRRVKWGLCSNVHLDFAFSSL
jgi:hypothetical protein